MSRKVLLAAGVTCILAGLALILGPNIAEWRKDPAPETPRRSDRSTSSATGPRSQNITQLAPPVSATEGLDATAGRRARTRAVDLPRTLDELRALARQSQAFALDNAEPAHSSDIPLDNGAHYFLLAHELMSEEMASRIAALWERFSAGHWSAEEVLELVESNHDVLAAVREGLEVGNAALPAMTNGPYEQLPYIQDWRQIARLMAMEGRMLLDGGDAGPALENFQSIIDFANQSSQGGALVHGVVTYANSAIAAEELRRGIDSGDFNPEQYREIIQRMAEYESGAPYGQELHAYEMEGMDVWLVERLRDGLDVESMLSREEWQDVLPAMSAEEFEANLDEFLQIRRELIDYIDRPYYELDEQVLDRIYGDNPLVDALFPDAMRIAASEATNTASLRATAIASAVEWYASDTGAYPETLDTLVPQYLPEAPIDPFTGEPFRYQETGNGYLLYSAGRDAADNGGTSGNPNVDGSDIIYHAP